MPGGDQLAEQAQREHEEVDQLLEKLQEADPADPEVDDLLQQLMQNFRQHAEEEEGPNGLFEQLKNALSEERLFELGERVAEEQARLATGKETLDEEADSKHEGTPGGVMFKA